MPAASAISQYFTIIKVTIKYDLMQLYTEALNKSTAPVFNVIT